MYILSFDDTLHTRRWQWRPCYLLPTIWWHTTHEKVAVKAVLFASYHMMTHYTREGGCEGRVICFLSYDDTLHTRRWQWRPCYLLPIIRWHTTHEKVAVKAVLFASYHTMTHYTREGGCEGRFICFLPYDDILHTRRWLWRPCYLLPTIWWHTTHEKVAVKAVLFASYHTMTHYTREGGCEGRVICFLPYDDTLHTRRWQWRPCYLLPTIWWHTTHEKVAVKAVLFASYHMMTHNTREGGCEGRVICFLPYDDTLHTRRWLWRPCYLLPTIRWHTTHEKVAVKAVLFASYHTMTHYTREGGCEGRVICFLSYDDTLHTRRWLWRPCYLLPTIWWHTTHEKVAVKAVLFASYHTMTHYTREGGCEGRVICFLPYDDTLHTRRWLWRPCYLLPIIRWHTTHEKVAVKAVLFASYHTMTHYTREGGCEGRVICFLPYDDTLHTRRWLWRPCYLLPIIRWHTTHEKVAVKAVLFASYHTMTHYTREGGSEGRVICFLPYDDTLHTRRWLWRPCYLLPTIRWHTTHEKVAVKAVLFASYHTMTHYTREGGCEGRVICFLPYGDTLHTRRWQWRPCYLLPTIRWHTTHEKVAVKAVLFASYHTMTHYTREGGCEGRVICFLSYDDTLHTRRWLWRPCYLLPTIRWHTTHEKVAVKAVLFASYHTMTHYTREGGCEGRVICFLPYDDTLHTRRWLWRPCYLLPTIRWHTTHEKVAVKAVLFASYHTMTHYTREGGCEGRVICFLPYDDTLHTRRWLWRPCYLLPTIRWHTTHEKVAVKAVLFASYHTMTHYTREGGCEGRVICFLPYDDTLHTRRWQWRPCYLLPTIRWHTTHEKVAVKAVLFASYHTLTHYTREGGCEGRVICFLPYDNTLHTRRWLWRPCYLLPTIRWHTTHEKVAVKAVLFASYHMMTHYTREGGCEGRVICFLPYDDTLHTRRWLWRPCYLLPTIWWHTTHEKVAVKAVLFASYHTMTHYTREGGCEGRVICFLPYDDTLHTRRWQWRPCYLLPTIRWHTTHEKVAVKAVLFASYHTMTHYTREGGCEGRVICFLPYDDTLHTRRWLWRPCYLLPTIRWHTTHEKVAVKAVLFASYHTMTHYTREGGCEGRVICFLPYDDTLHTRRWLWRPCYLLPTIRWHTTHEKVAVKAVLFASYHMMTHYTREGGCEGRVICFLPYDDTLHTRRWQWRPCYVLPIIRWHTTHEKVAVKAVLFASYHMMTHYTWEGGSEGRVICFLPYDDTLHTRRWLWRPCYLLPTILWHTTHEKVAVKAVLFASYHMMIHYTWEGGSEGRDICFLSYDDTLHTRRWLWRPCYLLPTIWWHTTHEKVAVKAVLFASYHTMTHYTREGGSEGRVICFLSYDDTLHTRRWLWRPCYLLPIIRWHTTHEKVAVKAVLFASYHTMTHYTREGGSEGRVICFLPYDDTLHTRRWQWRPCHLLPTIWWHTTHEKVAVKAVLFASYHTMTHYTREGGCEGRVICFLSYDDTLHTRRWQWRPCYLLPIIWWHTTHEKVAVKAVLFASYHTMTHYTREGGCEGRVICFLPYDDTLHTRRWLWRPCYLLPIIRWHTTHEKVAVKAVLFASYHTMTHYTREGGNEGRVICFLPYDDTLHTRRWLWRPCYLLPTIWWHTTHEKVAVKAVLFASYHTMTHYTREGGCEGRVICFLPYDDTLHTRRWQWRPCYLLPIIRWHTTHEKVAVKAVLFASYHTMTHYTREGGSEGRVICFLSYDDTLHTRRWQWRPCYLLPIIRWHTTHEKVAVKAVLFASYHTMTHYTREGGSEGRVICFLSYDDTLHTRRWQWRPCYLLPTIWWHTTHEKVAVKAVLFASYHTMTHYTREGGCEGRVICFLSYDDTLHTRRWQWRPCYLLPTIRWHTTHEKVAVKAVSFASYHTMTHYTLKYYCDDSVMCTLSNCQTLHTKINCSYNIILCFLPHTI